eukprot:gene11183-7760_t
MLENAAPGAGEILQARRVTGGTGTVGRSSSSGGSSSSALRVSPPPVGPVPLAGTASPSTSQSGGFMRQRVTGTAGDIPHEGGVSLGTYKDGGIASQREPASLYHRLDEGVAATIVQASTRWEQRRGSSSSSGPSSPTQQQQQQLFGGDEPRPRGVASGSSTSIFEKYRDNLVGSGGTVPNASSAGQQQNGNASGDRAGARSPGAAGRDHQQQQHYLNIRSTVARGGPSDPGSGGPAWKGEPGGSVAGGNLLSSDAERFMDFTMSCPPSQQLLQLRVLELFQMWVCTPGTQDTIEAVLQDARKQSGVEPLALSSGWEGSEQQQTAQKEPSTPNSSSAASSSATGAAGQIEEIDPATSKAVGGTPTLTASEEIRQQPASAPATSSTAPGGAGTGNPPEGKDSASKGEDSGGKLKPADPPATPASPSPAPAPAPPQTKVEEKVAARRVTGGASYEEIPRFYFPLGRPTTREKIISEPLYRYHENPHLRPPQDGPTFAISDDYPNGGESPSVSTRSTSRLSTSTSRSGSAGTGGGASSSGKSGKGAGNSLNPRIPPMSTLRFADDRNVPNYIKKEFTRLHAPSRHQKGRLSNSRRTPASKESQFRHHFHQCIQRVCSQCFGVPRYFGFIIIGLIQAELASSEEYTNLGGSVSGGLPFISPQSYAVITAEHVQEFYDKYLKNKDTLRRTFDLLILSSKLATPGESSGGKAGGVTDLTTLRAHIIGDDFRAYLLTLLAHHPGLAFLRETPDFQAKYLDTVVYRIFYEIDRFDRGGISFAEFIASPLMDAFRQVDAAEDINTVLLFFSYEHFYVLYCRFWKLDTDRDMLLSPQDLMRYAPEDAMNPLVVQRVFAGAGRRVRCTVKNRIGYEDFVWFCLSEEDKSTPPAIRYWFKVLDLDEDGILSAYEIRTFYEATTAKAAQYLPDQVTFENAICQVFDMLRCNEYRWLTLSDLLAEPVASYVALNMITSIIKFIQFECKDPFVLYQDRLSLSVEQRPWDRFARAEYDRMAQEEDD